ncbi:globin [Rhodobacteraceae bacterium F11138]|nr:globin [Rhodobacteraceae bacterium F11138]
MTLTSTEHQMVRDSLNRLRDEFDTRSLYFYEALFRREPVLRDLFREDLAGQGMKFMTTLAVILEKLNDEDADAAQYTGLGRQHASLGVKAADFAPMGEALIETLRAGLGADFTPELELAWHKAYAQVAAAMIRRGAIPGT